jgi:hypothetical protein
MGMILLDLSFRIEKAFKIEVPRQWLADMGLSKAGDDISLSGLHDYVLRLCDQQHVTAPADSWSKLVTVISDACGADESNLGPETMLVRDVAPFG